MALRLKWAGKMRRGCDCALSVEAAGTRLIGLRPGLTCHPGSAPNMNRLACAPRTSSPITNCLKELTTVMQHRLHYQIDRLPARAWLASVT
jgi:hypothetical protein